MGSGPKGQNGGGGDPVKRKNGRHDFGIKEEKKPGGAAPETEEVASATECTGLMPALPPEDEGEKEENLAGLYGVLPAGDGDE